MKKNKLFFCSGILFSSLILPTSMYSQDILWEKSFGGSNAEFLADVIPTPDYGFILAGSSLSGKTGNKNQTSHGNLDYWIWKMDENGELDWQKSFGGSGNDFLTSIKLTADGGFILGGISSSPGPSSESGSDGDKKEKRRGNDDFWIIKLNAGGAEEWQKTIGGIGQEKLKSICQTKDGGYMIGGSSASPKPYAGIEQYPDDLAQYGEKKSDSYGNMDYWIVKLDPHGKIEWQKTFGGIYDDELRSIESTNDGGYIVGGYSNSPASGNKTESNRGIGDFWVLKLDKKGEVIWQRTIGGNLDDQLYVIHQTYDGNYIVGGNSNSQSSNEKTVGNSNGTDFWLLKLGQMGEVLWQETFDIAAIDILTSIVENKDHTLLVGGYAQGQFKQKATNGKQNFEKNTGDYVALKLNEKGEEIWRQSVGSDGEDLLQKVIETRDGGYLLAGISSPMEQIMMTSNSGNTKQSGAPVNMKQSKPGQLQNATNEINDAISETQNDINKGINNTMQTATDAINKNIGSENNSSVNYGLNKPSAGVSLPAQGNESGGGMLNDLANSMTEKKGKKGTGGQAKVFGSNDFWVVKLRDKDKKQESKVSIEALPNPTASFTNVIVGYDYQNGTATVVDLSGRLLQQKSISGRTIPIDLSAYPEGIYVINIKTDIGNDGIKVVKRANGN